MIHSGSILCQSHSTQHNTTQHNITQHNTTQHNTTQHNTTQHTEYSPALLMGWVPGAKPPTTGPGHHPNGWCTNSVGCTRAPAPSTTPEGAHGPLVPAARAPGTDQRSLERTAGTASPSISPQRLCPTHRALCPNSIPHTPMQHSVPPMHYLPRPLPATSPAHCPPPPPPSPALAPLTGWQGPCGAPPGPRIGGRPREQLGPDAPPRRLQYGVFMASVQVCRWKGPRRVHVRGPRPSRGAVPGNWPRGPGATGAEVQVKVAADAVTFRKSPKCASWTCRLVPRGDYCSVPGLCLAGVANRQTNLIFRHAGTRVLTDDTQNAFSESLLRRASGNAGVLKTGAAGLRPVKLLEEPSPSPSGWTPRYRYPTSFEVRYKAPRPPPRRQHQGGRPGGVTAPDPPKAAPKVSAPLEGHVCGVNKCAA